MAYFLDPELAEKVRELRQRSAGINLAERPATAKSSGTVRRNRYATNCDKCGEKVAANEGILGDKRHGRWITTHETCP